MKTNNLPHFLPFKNQTGNTCQMQTVAAICQAITRRAGLPDTALSTWYLLYEAQRREGLPFGDTITGGVVPSMGAVLDVAMQQGIPPEWMQSYYGQPSQAAHGAAAGAKMTGHYSIPVDPYNAPATAALVRAALEKGHFVSVGVKLRRWLRDLSAPEDQHLQIAASVMPGSYENEHVLSHRLVVSDINTNVAGWQGLGFELVNSVGSGWGGERGIAIVGPQFFKDAIDIVAIPGFAGCNDRFTYDADGIPGQVYRLYQAAYNRLPDKGGMGFQIDALAAGRGLQQLASDFLASPEGEVTYPPNTTNAQYVDRLYDNVLHRPGDAQGRASHLADLATGTPRRDKLLHFSESPENKAACAPAFDKGVAYT